MPFNHGRVRQMRPTFQGFVSDTTDALLLFEAVLRRQLFFIPRRLVPGEYANLIKSGNIFIYEEHESGIKRWTDGRPWSPSRVLDNFLVYRESEKLSVTGEKKKTLKRKYSSTVETPPPQKEPQVEQAIDSPTGTIEPRAMISKRAQTAEDKEFVKSLAGSFTDDNLCLPGGLVKKTLSVLVNGLTYHMVSYYTVADVKNSLLPRPSSDPNLAHIAIRPDLYKQNFRQAIYMPAEHSSTRPNIASGLSSSLSSSILPNVSSGYSTGLTSSISTQDVFLSLAPGSNQIQLRQTTPTHQTPTFGMSTSSTFSNEQLGLGNGAAVRAVEPNASQSYRQTRPLEWNWDWQQAPKMYYSPSMALPPSGFMWNDAMGFGSQHTSAATSTTTTAAAAAPTASSSSLSSMQPQPQPQQQHQQYPASSRPRPLLPAPDVFQGRGFAVR